MNDIFCTSLQIIRAFDDFVATHSLVGRAKADHICYKCASTKSFEEIRSTFEGDSAFVYQSIIAGRRIAIIRFHEPLKTALGPISLLELSDQKPDGSQKDGLEHIEIYPTHGSTNDLVTHLTSQNVTIKTIVRPHHTTHDMTLVDDFKIRIENEPLMQKIVQEEIMHNKLLTT